MLKTPDRLITLKGGLPPMHQRLPDYLQPGLKVVFVGFNPGERSARIGHYYAGRGNQFWNLLYESGLVREKLRPEDDHRILEFGLGLTDVVKRWSPSSSSLRAIDYKQGIPQLLAKLHQVQPRTVAFNGKLAYEKVAGGPVQLGLQREILDGLRVFVLPSTSGRNGSLTRAAKLRYFRLLAQWVKKNG
jgi:double-stranded uracil-DNA glycosylase